jgi:hypothetical protein
MNRVFLGVLIVAVVVSGAWAQTPSLNPQALLGRWSGSWIGAHQAKHSGKYYLTIERVEGDKVSGKREISGRKETESKVSGRLSGNLLTFGKTALTIDGDEMRGSGEDYKITLTREK